MSEFDPALRRKFIRIWTSIALTVGFALSAYGSALGSAPPWPNRWVWCILGAAAALSCFVYLFIPGPVVLRLSTVCISVAAFTRGLGYATSGTTTLRLTATGAWLIVFALAAIRHERQRGL